MNPSSRNLSPSTCMSLGRSARLTPHHRHHHHQVVSPTTSSCLLPLEGSWEKEEGGEGGKEEEEGGGEEEEEEMVMKKQPDGSESLLKSQCLHLMEKFGSLGSYGSLADSEGSMSPSFSPPRVETPSCCIVVVDYDKESSTSKPPRFNFPNYEDDVFVE